VSATSWRLVVTTTFAAALAVSLLAVPPNRPARAATLCVNPTGTGGCYATIQAAVDAASPGDTINIAAGTYTETVTIHTANLSLNGAGADRTTLNGYMYHDASDTTISATSFTGEMWLGCIWNRTTGSITLTNVSIANCRTNGIFNEGAANLTNVAITNNGGIRPTGWGVDNMGTANLTNVTLSGNFQYAISNPGLATLTNTTIAHNEIANSGTMTLSNTIIAYNPTNCANVGGGNYISLGYNLSDDNTCPLNNTSDITDTDPLLAPCGYYGGSTRTHALLVGSPAIDTGDDAACPPTDQRGFARPYGSHCDIGAYEYQPPFWLFFFFPFISK